MILSWLVIGKVEVNGSYLCEDLLSTNTFSEEIPFNIIFSNENFEINDIDCVELDYNIVDGRGIEVLFDILLEYEEFNSRELETIKEENILENPVEKEEDIIEIPVLVEENIEYEEIKESKELEIDNLIKSELEEVEDNLPTLENNFEKYTHEKNAEDKRSTIKVCYYKDSSDLDTVCFNKNVGIDKIFNDNKKTDFVKYRRVIIKWWKMT